jgi:hypothetical protein
VVVITRKSALVDSISGKIDIFIDGRLERSLEKKEQARIIIPNGEHTMYAKSHLLQTDTVVFSAYSKLILFEVSFGLGYIKLSKTSENALAPAKQEAMDHAGSGANSAKIPIDTAIIQAADDIIDKLHPKTKTGIFNVSAGETEFTEYVIEELTVVLVNKGSLTMVDRRSLDVIQAEQDFQLNGNTSDESIISIGQMTGAETVITCSVSGSGDLRRLRIKALNVKTAEIQSLTSYNIY